MKQKSWKRLGVVLLTLTMLLSLVPSEVFAVDVPALTAEGAQKETYKIHVETQEGIALAKVYTEDQNMQSVSEAAPGETIYMEFIDVNMTPGTAFVKWVDDKGNLTDIRNSTEYYGCSFTMPAEDVSIHAQLAENCPTIMVENGGMMVRFGKDYYVLNHTSVYPKRTVHLYYDDKKTPDRKVFSEWYVKSGRVEFSDPARMDTSIYMVSNQDVEIGVKYEDAYGVSVENGYAQYYRPNGEYIWNTSTAKQGTQMYLKVNPYTKPEGMAFSKWVVKQGTVILEQPESSYSCPFIMPSEDVEIVAEFVPGHALTVEGGITLKTMSDGNLDWYIDTVAAGDQVWADCSYEDDPQGMEFDRWVVTQGSVKLECPEEKACSFIMPDEDVIVTATYTPVGGKAEVGWHSDAAGSWYNDETGHYVTGWQDIDGKRYYFHANGYMAKDEWIDGHYVDGSGALVEKPVDTGWQHNENGWWYNDANGNYVTGWQVINGYWYYFASNGYMQTGWQQINGYWYYFASGGDMQTGWQQINGYWYYFASGGDMQTGWQWIDGKCYYFYPDGWMAANTWINGSYVNGSGAWVK